MKTTTIRWAPAAHHVVETAARRNGASLAQYVRESTLMRAAWEGGLAAGQLAPQTTTVEQRNLIVEAVRTWLDEQ